MVIELITPVADGSTHDNGPAGDNYYTTRSYIYGSGSHHYPARGYVNRAGWYHHNRPGTRSNPNHHALGFTQMADKQTKY